MKNAKPKGKKRGIMSVPQNAKIHIDFLNNVAWTETDGEVPIDALLGSDENTVNGWGASGYDPATGLTTAGYSTNVSGWVISVAFIGLAKAKVLASATIVCRCNITENVVSTALMSADGVNALEQDLWANEGILDATSYVQGSLNQQLRNVTIVGDNIFAVSVSDTSFKCAANGSAVIGGSIGETDRPSANPFVAALLDSNVNRIQSVTIYDLVSDDSAISALSTQA